MTYPGWIQDPPTPLTPTARRLLCRVWELQQETGWCFAKQQTLAADLAVKPLTIKRAVATAARLGGLEMERRTVYGTNRRVNYMRVLPALQAQDAEPDTKYQRLRVAHIEME